MAEKIYAHLNVSVDCVIFGWSGEDLNVLLIEQKRAEKNKHLGRCITRRQFFFCTNLILWLNPEGNSLMENYP